MTKCLHPSIPAAVLAALLPCALLAPPAAPAAESAADKAGNTLAYDIFKQLIEINTTDSVGSVTAAAEAMAQRFRAAGYSDVFVGGPNERKKNVVIRLRGSGRHKPVLLIGHLDVVEAKREDWTTDPFKFIEKDGYFYGRGSSDMKDGDAIMAATMIRLKQEGFRPDRDIILALTADEEGGCCNGPAWLIKNHRDLVDAEFVLNHDGSSLKSEHGKPVVFQLGASEKVYADYQLITTNKGGHSSQPRPDNAIYELAQGLLKIGAYQFPFELNSITRAYFERMAAGGGEDAASFRGLLQSPPDPAALKRLMAIPAVATILHTTCVATRLDGGHANNALPQRATANVNCRILPGHSKEEVRRELIKVLGDAKITVRYVADDGTTITDTAPDQRGFPPPPMRPEVQKPLDELVAAMWPGVKVIPYMDGGASDAIYTSVAGMPTYGVSAVAIDRDDERAHGRDERIGVKAFYEGNEFFYRYLKSITTE